MEQPCKSNLSCRGAQRSRNCIQDGGLQRSEPAQWKEWDERDALAYENIDQSVIEPAHEIVMVLDAQNLGNLFALMELANGDVAEADMRINPCCLSPASTERGSAMEFV